jgi:hypothetical protein
MKINAPLKRETIFVAKNRGLDPSLFRKSLDPARMRNNALLLLCVCLSLFPCFHLTLLSAITFASDLFMYAFFTAGPRVHPERVAL